MTYKVREPKWSDQLMSPAHPRWDEFCRELAGPGYCDFGDSEERGFTFRCDHTLAKSAALLREMGFEQSQIVDSLTYFESRGGYCDCEVLFNVEASAGAETGEEQ